MSPVCTKATPVVHVDCLPPLHQPHLPPSLVIWFDHGSQQSLGLECGTQIWLFLPLKSPSDVIGSEAVTCSGGQPIGAIQIPGHGDGLKDELKIQRGLVQANAGLRQGLQEETSPFSLYLIPRKGSSCQGPVSGTENWSQHKGGRE